MTAQISLRSYGHSLAAVILALATMLAASRCAAAAAPPWQVGLASARITPEGPIRMAGYAGRQKPSEGVLADLYAKALAIRCDGGEPAVLLTADVIGYDASLAEAICAAIAKKTGLKRPQILLSVSHIHTGPILGLGERTGYSISAEEAQHVRKYTEKLLGQLVELSAAALGAVQPARLSWGVGVAGFVMNRREFTERGVQLGVNPQGYADRSVPVLRIDSPEGNPRAVLFGCATHNTTFGPKELRISGDYAGFAQQVIEKEQPGVQAMFMIGCAGSSNPYPRDAEEFARQHGQALGAEVCRVAAGKLQAVGGPLRVELDYAELPLQPVPPRERLEQMAKGSSGPAANAKRMLDALEHDRPLPTHYRAPLAIWQFGRDLTLVALSGEVVGEYVPMLLGALGHRGLWIAAYCNDDYGYLPTATVLEEGGYETRGLIPEVGYFSPQAQDVLLAKVRQLAEKAGRTLPRADGDR